MRFEEIASKAGEHASRIGGQASRAPFAGLVSQRRRSRLVSAWSTAAIAMIGVVAIALALPPGQGPEGPAVSPTSASPPSTVTTSAGPSSTTTTTTVAGLRPEFLAWVAPMDGDEARLGWEAFGLPDQEPKFLAMAACWEENGYGEFAGHLRGEASVMPASALDVHLIPMRRLREVGFTDEPDFWAGLIAESAGPRGIPGGLEGDLQHGPDRGLRLNDVAGIRMVGEMCWPKGWIPIRGMGSSVETFDDQWITRIAELDREPELAKVIEDKVTPCLRAIDPYFEKAIDPYDWVSRAAWAPQNPQDVEDGSEMWAMPEETLLAWGQAFADCMEPLEEARRPLRLAAREAWVNQWYDQLIDFQAQDGLQTGGS